MQKRELLIYACVTCGSTMSLRKSMATMERGQQQWFYFLVCGGCGEGPNRAYESWQQAVLYWNKKVIMEKQKRNPQWQIESEPIFYKRKQQDFAVLSGLQKRRNSIKAEMLKRLIHSDNESKRSWNDSSSLAELNG